MSEHMFVVTVKVTGWDSDRDPADYAAQALLTAGLPDAARLDGFADLAAEADITDVAPFD
jgi:hypothetical protein